MRQKKLALSIVDNATSSKPMNKQSLVASVGYSALSADRKATEIIDSKGTQEELIKLGFTPFNAKKVVSEIMNGDVYEPQHRLKAADMALQVFGEYAPEKSINMNINAKDLEATITQDLNRFRAK